MRSQSAKIYSRFFLLTKLSITRTCWRYRFRSTAYFKEKLHFDAKSLFPILLMFTGCATNPASLQSYGRSGDAEHIRTVVAKIPKSDRKSFEVSVALSNAIEGGHSAAIAALLDSGVDDWSCSEPLSPFVRAVEKNATDVLAKMLEIGNEKTVSSCASVALPLAIQAKNSAQVELLMAKAAQLNYSIYVNSFLMEPIPFGFVIHPRPVLVNKQRVGVTALGAALVNKDIDTVRLLLSRGADPNQPFISRPVQIAGIPAEAFALLQPAHYDPPYTLYYTNKADINDLPVVPVDLLKNGPIGQSACVTSGRGMGVKMGMIIDSCMMQALYYPQIPMPSIEQPIISLPLHFAVLNNIPDAVQLLLKAPVDWQIHDVDGKTVGSYLNNLKDLELRREIQKRLLSASKSNAE